MSKVPCEKLRSKPKVPQTDVRHEGLHRHHWAKANFRQAPSPAFEQQNNDRLEPLRYLGG